MPTAHPDACTTSPPAHQACPAHLCVVAQVSLKAKALNDGQQRLDNEDGRAWLRQIRGHMASAAGTMGKVDRIGQAFKKP